MLVTTPPTSELPMPLSTAASCCALTRAQAPARPERTDLFGQSVRFSQLGDELTRDSDVVEYERNFNTVGRTHMSASLGRFPIEAIDEVQGTRLHSLTFGELPSVSRARMIGRNENV